jgi:hypothetical protein
MDIWRSPDKTTNLVDREMTPGIRRELINMKFVLNAFHFCMSGMNVLKRH